MKFLFATVATFMCAVSSAVAQVPQPVPAPAPAIPIPKAPAPASAKAWVVMDYASGQVLAGENIHTHLAPASLTKVMTSYVIAAEIKNGKVHRDDQVMMTENAWRKEALAPMAVIVAFLSTRLRAWRIWSRA